MPITSEKFKTDYYFKKQDNRNPIVFIHGVGLKKEMWTPQIEFFKDHNVLTVSYTHLTLPTICSV